MQSPPSRRTVLCVDDVPVILDLLKMVFRAKGYLPLGARDGRQALNIAASVHVDAVVLDYFMPGMNGGEVAAELRRMQPEVPIIMFSGSFHTLPRMLIDADAFVEKGNGMQPLVAVVDRLVKGGKQQPRPVRRFRRFDVNLPFAVLADRDGRTTMLHGRCKSVSEGGLGGAVEGKLKPGELVLIRLSDPRMPSALEPRAQVRYQNSENCGFEFVDVTPDQQLGVRHFCEQLALA
ncbi:MAG: response regulator [Terriglobales bacterium]